MIQYINHFITLFALLLFPVLPGLCECVDVSAKDHGCCHEDFGEKSRKYPCPDAPDLCVHNPQHIETVVQSVSNDSIEADFKEIKSSKLFLKASARLPGALWLAVIDGQSHSLYDVSIHLPPARGPPVLPVTIVHNN